jgi:hypothetical protein
MPIYDPTGHPRLSEEARSLTPEQLAMYADGAEALLDYVGTSYEGAEYERSRLAVAIQINFALRREAREASDVVAETKGDQKFEYARDRDGMLLIIDPEALAIRNSQRTAEAVEPPRRPGSTSGAIGFTG